MYLRDFVADFHPGKWLVEGLIPHGHLVFMGGIPGAGKSWIAEALAIHIAGGQRYLDLPVMKGAVILVDEDTPQDELQKRLLRLAAGPFFITC